MSSVTQESPYQFRLYSDNLWTDLSRVYLFLELSVEKPSPTVPGRWVQIDDSDTQLGCIQGLGQTFVRQLKVSISNTEIYDSGTLYAYKSYMTNELSFPASVKESFLAAAGYYPTRRHNDAGDAGFKSRVALFSSAKQAHLMSRLDFDMGNQELYLVNNIDVLFTIYRNSNAFLLHSLKMSGDALPDYRLFVHSARLYVKMVDVQSSLNLTIYRMLEQQPARYAVRKTDVRSCFIGAGRTEIDHAVFSSTIPRRLTVALVANAAFNGDYKLTPFEFKHFNIESICAQAGGFNYPALPYRLDFAQRHCMNAFVDMYEALGHANNIHTCDIGFEQFLDGWSFFVIPLTSTLDDSCGFELIRSGTTSLRLKFSKAIPVGGVEMIVLGEFDQLIMVDYNRRVIADNSLA